ncbi:uncharacterized protein LOC124263356 [Haliotis rubra]|uniref:uncharacterized protein LOC124263356 n=1 Tax=Haliotis rubra TaxID=36100 RepID=UPI001EE52212|nr:uncharacterized protein LOC124263356 [Haliotis rubra]
MDPRWNLIDFEATDPPPWMKESGASQDRAPPVRDMIKNIRAFQQQWQELTEQEQQKRKMVFVPIFIHHICVEEDLGLQTKSETISVFHSMQNDLRKFKKKPDEENIEERKVSKSNSMNKQEIETTNLIKAWLHLWQCLDPKSPGSDSLDGLIDIDVCITKTHKIIMNDLVNKANKTPAGCFSTETRYTTYKGEEHHYPKFETPEDAWKAVQIICDRYNALIDRIQQLDDSCDKMYKMFKCAAWLLFNLVSLHPFSDGNGRLCRLLCSYALGVATPFPSPVYNVYSPSEKSDYIDGIVSARKRNPQYPKELTTLIIESNWFAWKAILSSDCKDADHEDEPLAKRTACEDEPIPAGIECEQDSL